MSEFIACVIVASGATAYVTWQLARTNMDVGPNVERYHKVNDFEGVRWLREEGII